MNVFDKVLAIARAELGYLEKKSNAKLDSKTENAGYNNYTKYARDLYPSLQGQYWCDMFVDWVYVQAFGRKMAEKLLGGFSAYTPTSADFFKSRNRYYKNPKEGDIVFFKNSVRICHTGIVIWVSGSRFGTIEGNTSTGSGVIPNGGGVCEKSYSISEPKIDGFGRPDYSIVAADKYTVGWSKDSTGWWYAYNPSNYYKNEWATINHHKYYFNEEGYAVTGWQTINNRKYFFEPTAGHPLECALYVSDKDGAQQIGEF